MSAWRIYGAIVCFVLCPTMAMAGQSQSGQQRAGQQDRSQRAQYSAQELQQIQQLARQGDQQQQTLSIDQAIRQAQQEAKGVVVEAALSFEGAADQSQGQRSRARQGQSAQRSTSQEASRPSWQIQVLNPEEGRLTQFQVDAQTGQITDRQEYPIQQLSR